MEPSRPSTRSSPFSRRVLVLVIAMLAGCGGDGDPRDPRGSESRPDASPTEARRPDSPEAPEPEDRTLAATSEADASPAETPTDPIPAPEPEPRSRFTPEPRVLPPSVPIAAANVVELQPSRRSSEIRVGDEAGRQGRATLIDLQPAVGRWWVLELAWDDGVRRRVHLEVSDPTSTRLGLDAALPRGLVLSSGSGTDACPLWSNGSMLETGDAPWTSVCEGRVFVRGTPKGRRTRLEAATEVLRSRVVGGERITNLVRRTVYRDRQRESGRSDVGDEGLAEAAAGPRPAPIDPPRLLPLGELGLPARTRQPGEIQAGRWREIEGLEGVWASAILPALARPEAGGRELPLDSVEAEARVHLVAFDLGLYELAFELGTDHPSVGWSDRARPEVVDPRLAGPDGYGDLLPLQRPGSASPSLVPRVVATFTAGFKREHSAFKHGTLAARNRGSHYGLVSQGVILSRLQPGLATVLVDLDGHLDLRTWTPADEARLGNVLFARQNGVAVVERGPDGGGRPGDLVTSWGEGNWSGSIDGKLRAVRGGVGLQEHPDGRRYLIYAYFSTATPAAMARVFLAYGCRYAMLLDMNALEHTYLAVYRPGADGDVGVAHLVRGMEEVDTEIDGRRLPRFLAVPDNRDFFLVTRRPGIAAP